VVTTLVEAIVMVFLIIFLFLQNFRATFIPTIVIPVALLGTFAVMYALGFSINVLTMFGMVLASANWWTTPSWWWKTWNAS
jgi:multidrug efflux pump subunit AcrB